MKPKISANERRLAKLLDEFNDNRAWGVDSAPLAAFLAKHGVLAVCAGTVDEQVAVAIRDTLEGPSVSTDSQIVRAHLLHAARGAR